MARTLLIAVFLLPVVFVLGCSQEDDEAPPPPPPQAPVIPAITLQDGLEGLAYSAQIPAEGGSEEGFAWNVTSGFLPTGLSLAPSGTPETTLSGTPAEDGLFHFTVEVSDSAGQAATREFDLRIHPAGTLFIVTPSCTDGSEGVAYGQDLEATGGTGTGYTWSLADGVLPPGLTLDGNNETLSWGSFSLTGNIDRTWTLENANELNEVSGVAASKAHAGVLWVHDDSWWWGTPGNPANPYFYAIDELGHVLQKYAFASYNRDIEDICMGPGPDPDSDYLYIGDVGDNNLVRTDLRIIRVKEPVPPAIRESTITVPHEEFWFTYPNGSRDCEAIFMNWETGVLYLMDKNAGGHVYRFPGPMDASWTSSSPATLVLVKSGLQPSGNNTITGADASRDCRRVVFRGYGSGDTWEFARPAGGTFDSIFDQTCSTFASVGGNQFEAIAYGGNGTSLYTLTENSPQPIYRADALPGPYDTTISGTPTAGGVYTFTIRVTDSAGETATRTYTIKVD